MASPDHIQTCRYTTLSKSSQLLISELTACLVTQNFVICSDGVLELSSTSRTARGQENWKTSWPWL